MHWIPYGPNAFLLHFASRVNDEAFLTSQKIVHYLRSTPIPHLIEWVPGFTHILLEWSQPPNHQAWPEYLQDLLQKIESFHLSMPSERHSPLIKTIPVHYNGPDLLRVAQHNRLTLEQVITLHTSPTYKVHCLGFSPGFPYLGGLPPQLHTPRLDSPRIKIPPGSVAIGGEHTGIYTVPSAGGWNLIGHTSIPLFDPTPSKDQASRDESHRFYLQPGDLIRFTPQPPSAHEATP